MAQQKYVIVDIHQEDAFSGQEDKNKLLGQVCMAWEDLHNTTEIPEYVGGTLEFETPVDLGDVEDPDMRSILYFYAVQLQTIEDNRAENDKIVTVEEK